MKEFSSKKKFEPQKEIKNQLQKFLSFVCINIFNLLEGVEKVDDVATCSHSQVFTT